MKTLVIEIFRPGTHVSMSGEAIPFSEADLQACATGYDKSKHEAPIVIGHPKTDDPAYGWVEGLEFRDGALHASLIDLDDGFAGDLKARRYDKRSPAFYAPNAKGNPNPGSWSLRHVGFLGAQVPGCKGLKPIAFAEEDEAVVFAESPMWSLAWALGSLAGIFRRMRDKLIEKTSVEEADAQFPDWSIRELEDAAKGLRDAAAEAKPVLSPAFAEDPAQVIAFAERTTALDTREAEIKRREDEQAARDAQRVTDEDTAFVEGLVSAGRVAPGRKAEVIALLQSADDITVVAFSEGEQSTAKAHLKKVLGAKTPIISFAEVGAGEDVPTDAVAVANAATAHIADQASKGITIKTEDAVRHVLKGSK